MKPLSFICIALVFSTIYSLINCSVYGESCRNYSPLSFRFFTQPFVKFWEKKNVIHQPRSVRIGKNCALCLVYRPRPTTSALKLNRTLRNHKNVVQQLYTSTPNRPKYYKWTHSFNIGANSSFFTYDAKIPSKYKTSSDQNENFMSSPAMLC